MRPFIIWTLQRTGGTNFAANIIKLSGLPTTEHEPLNPGRAYGHIVEQWEGARDPEALQRELASFLEKGYAIKHCVETVPWAINDSLVDESVARGYNHLVLHRVDSLARLLSLHFARETGIWGRKKAAALRGERGEAYLEELNVATLPVAELVRHEDSCLDMLASIATQLMIRRANILLLSYEDIYCAGPDAAEERLSTALNFLGFSTQQLPENTVQRLTSIGDQGSRHKYREIDGVDALKTALANISPLEARLQDQTTPSF